MTVPPSRRRPAVRTGPATARGPAAPTHSVRSAPRGPVRAPRLPAPSFATVLVLAVRGPSTFARPSFATRPPINARRRAPPMRTAFRRSSASAEAAGPKVLALPAGPTPNATPSIAPTGSAATPLVVAPVSRATRSDHRSASARRFPPASRMRSVPSRTPRPAARPGCATVRGAVPAIPPTRPAAKRSASTPPPGSPPRPATASGPVLPPRPSPAEISPARAALAPSTARAKPTAPPGTPARSRPEARWEPAARKCPVSPARPTSIA